MSGSKIIVTTRNMGVVSAITGTCSSYTLAELSFDDRLKHGFMGVVIYIIYYLRLIYGLTCLKHGFRPYLAALENLVICDCDELTSLWENGLGADSLGHLQHLKIQGCPALVSLEEQCLPCSLEYLEIKGCANLEKLPNGLQNLTS